MMRMMTTTKEQDQLQLRFHGLHNQLGGGHFIFTAFSHSFRNIQLALGVYNIQRD